MFTSFSTFANPIIHRVYLLKFYIVTVFDFSWDMKMIQEKSKTMAMQSFLFFILFYYSFFFGGGGAVEDDQRGKKSVVVKCERALLPFYFLVQQRCYKHQWITK